MHDGYLNARPTNRAALTTTIALHALALAGLFAYNPGIVGDVITYLPGRAIPAPVPQPDVPLPPQPKTKARIDDRSTPPVAPPDRSTATSTTALAWPEPTPLPPIDLGNGSGVGIALEPMTPVVDPVLVAASLDMRATRDLQPPYPPALQRADIEGSVTVSLRIGTDGRVIDVTLVRADDPAFFTATRDWALRHWRFRPATRDGTPVVGTLTKTVRFVIDR